MLAYLGIDPGKTGGMAIVPSDRLPSASKRSGGKSGGSPVVFPFANKTEADIWSFFCQANENYILSLAAIEKVNAGVFGSFKNNTRKRKHSVVVFCPHCHKKPRVEVEIEEPQTMGVSSAFTFGRAVGLLYAFLTAAEIRFEEVAPVSWQTSLKCRTRGDKNVSKRKAQQLFPSLKITHGVADALLLAEYARRLDLGLFKRKSK